MKFSFYLILGLCSIGFHLFSQCPNNTGTWNVTGNYTNYNNCDNSATINIGIYPSTTGVFMNQTGVTFTNHVNATFHQVLGSHYLYDNFYNYGTYISDHGQLNNYGMFKNFSGATFSNNYNMIQSSGTFENYASLSNNSGMYFGGSLINKSGGTILHEDVNIEQLNPYYDSCALVNYLPNGTTQNELGAVFYNKGYAKVQLINGGYFENYNILNVIGVSSNTGTIDNLAGSTTNILSATIFNNNAPFYNRGNFNNNATLINTGNFNNYSGAVLVNNGTFINNQYFTNESGASIYNFGIWSGHNQDHQGSFSNIGTLLPGQNGSSFYLVNQDYTHENSATLEIHISGPASTGIGINHNYLQAYGNIYLNGGTVNVVMDSSYLPTVGEEFIIAQGVSVTGTFNQLNITNQCGTHFTLVYQNASVRLVCTAIDTLAPVISTIPAIFVQLDSSGTGNLDPNVYTTYISDECNFTLTASQTDFNCTQLGSNMLTLTAEDMYGNASQAPVEIIVLNNNDFEAINANITGLKNGSLSWGDYNDDHFSDLLITGDDGSSGLTKLYKNINGTTFNEVPGLNLIGLTFSSCDWSDYDLDGDLDFVIMGDNGSQNITQLYQNLGNDQFQLDPSGSIIGLSRGDLHFHDFNNDGFEDLIVTGYTNGGGGKTTLYENTNGSGFTEITSLPFVHVYFSNLALGDYNNDGWTDVLVTGFDGSQTYTTLYANSGNFTFTATSNVFPNLSDASASFGNFNQDNFPDLLLTGADNGNPSSALYTNNGDGTFTLLSNSLTESLVNSSVIWADLNHDSYDDLLVLGRRGPLNDYFTAIYANNRDSTFSNPYTVSIPYLNVGDISVTDMDHDGDLDFAILGENTSYTPFSEIYRNLFICQCPEFSSVATLQMESCDSIVSPSGNYTWTSSGMYLDTVPNTVGCDSIMNIQLTINQVNNSILNNDPTLQALTSGALYQWYDCNTGLPIPGATSQSFTPSDNGSYQVEVTQNGCSDFSSCEAVISLAVDALTPMKVTIYPNPTSGTLFIQFDNTVNVKHIEITNETGHVILSKNVDHADKILEVATDMFANGVYFIRFKAEETTFVRKFVVKR